MSSNGGLGCPEEMQVESAAESIPKQLEIAPERPPILNDNVTDANSMYNNKM